jgi:hypothetical protein
MNERLGAISDKLTGQAAGAQIERPTSQWLMEVYDAFCDGWKWKGLF